MLKAWLLGSNIKGTGSYKWHAVTTSATRLNKKEFITRRFMFETATDMTNEKEITSTLKVQNP